MSHSFQPWTNPRGLAAANRQVTSGAWAVQSHGPDIWDHICAIGSHNEPFRPHRLVTPWLAAANHIKERTAQMYVGAFLAYCIAAPEDFSGPASKLVRIRRGLYRLEDNPERPTNQGA
jgi:hypothetical protein